MNPAKLQAWKYAHEVFHASQYAYTYGGPCAAFTEMDEATAMWAAEHVYPDDDVHHHRHTGRHTPWIERSGTPQTRRLADEESDTGAGHACAPLQPLVTDGQGDSDRLVEVEACCTVRAEKQLGFTERRRRFSPGTVAPQPCDRPAEQVDCGGRVTAIERG